MDGSLRARFAIDRGAERLDVVGAFVPVPVDEERRSSGDTAVVGAVDVALDSEREPASLEGLLEARHIETDVVRGVDDIDDAEGRLPVEEPVVHLPERALLAGGLGRLGCLLCVLVDVDEREMTEHVSEFSPRRREELTDDGFGLPAIRALEIAVLDQRHGRVGGAADVIALRVDGIGEIDDGSDGRLLARARADRAAVR